MADQFSNISVAHVLQPFGLLVFGTVLGWLLALGFVVAAVVTGIRDGYSNRVLAMALFAVIFLSTSLFDHYLAVMAPLILWAWPIRGMRGRIAIAVFL